VCQALHRIRRAYCGPLCVLERLGSDVAGRVAECHGVEVNTYRELPTFGFTLRDRAKSCGPTVAMPACCG
jgi:hypothetical protein